MAAIDDGIIGDRESWEVADDSGPLVLVKLSNNVSVKMREDKARALGLLDKAKKPAKNKMRKQSENKSGG